MNKHDQSDVRLRSIAAVAVGLLLLGAARPGVAPVRAAATGNRGIQSFYGATATVPDSNPYSNPTQCVYRAWDLAAQAGYKLPYFGNAALWRAGAIDAGYVVIDTVDASAAHSVAVWGSGVGGASWAGHVGWVVDVKDGEFLVQDRNWIAYGTDDERWVTWEPGISFIVLEHVGPAATAAPAPTATPEPTHTPHPTPSARPTSETGTPAVSPTPVAWQMATAVPAGVRPAQDVPAERRVADSPASRSGRPVAAPGNVVVLGGAPLSVPWQTVVAPNWGDILGLSGPGAEPAGSAGQSSGPLRWPATPTEEASATGGGGALGGLSSSPLPSLWPVPATSAGE